MTTRFDEKVAEILTNAQPVQNIETIDEAKRKSKFRKTAKKVHKKYDELFKRLAK